MIVLKTAVGVSDLLLIKKTEAIYAEIASVKRLNLLPKFIQC